MNHRQTYDFITKKLGRTSAPDTAALWQQMSAVLDQEMPQQKKRRFFWLFPMSAWWLLLGLSGMAAAGIYFTRHQNSSRINTGTEKAVAPIAPSAATAPEQTQPNTPAALPSQPSVPAPAAPAATPITAEKDNSSVSETKTIVTKAVAAKTSVHKKTGRSQAQSSVPVKSATSPAPAGKKDDSQIDAVKNETQAAIASSVKYWKHIDGASAVKLKFNPLARAADRNSIAHAPKAPARRDRGFTAGIGLQMQMAVGEQQKSSVGYSGSSSTTLDYLPSLFVEYHLNKKLSFRTGVQWMTPQYVPQFSMYEDYLDATTDQYREENIVLKKLYYLTVPLTVQYKVLPHLQVGAGLEYAYLTHSVFEKESCLWREDAGTWRKAWQNNTMNAKSANDNVSPAQMTAMDTAAVSIQPHDWRLLVNVGYQWKRLQLGVQASSGLRPYINTTQKGYLNAPVRDVSRSLQFYLHYTLFDRRKK